MNTALLLFTVIIALGVSAWALWMVKIHQSYKTKPVQDAQDAAVNALAQQVVLDLGEKLDTLKEFDTLATRKAQLEVEVGNLTVEKADAEHGFARMQRELEHAAGLMRKELDAELERVKAQVGLDADKKVLAAERRYSQETMEAREKAFDQQLARTDEITERLFKLVPNIEARLRLKGDV
ncbi:hypothetical protein LCGC14_1379220 [marine sediment metagenome]|uniref:DNA recombination protein RmuC n=1 Tax=marine sediment metagenome TaxID=412755 RepID=A0A0F9K390_9ZZZZ